MLVGTWKNIQDLEDNLTMEELNLIIQAQREQEYRLMRFQAAMKGVNLDEGRPGAETGQEVIDRLKKKHEKIASGMSEEEFEREETKAELADFGITFEVIND